MKSKIKCKEKYNNPCGGSRGVRGVPSNPLNWNHSRQRNCKILIRMTFWLKKVRPQNTMTWLQNVGNRISEDLNFRGCPRTPYKRPPSAVLLSNPLLWNPGSAPDILLSFYQIWTAKRSWTYLSITHTSRTTDWGIVWKNTHTIGRVSRFFLFISMAVSLIYGIKQKHLSNRILCVVFGSIHVVTVLQKCGFSQKNVAFKNPF